MIGRGAGRPPRHEEVQLSLRQLPVMRHNPCRQKEGEQELVAFEKRAANIVVNRNCEVVLDVLEPSGQIISLRAVLDASQKQAFGGRGEDGITQLPLKKGRVTLSS